ncbi:10007_t:CDS:2 [Paraglomus brasilianum]|uniref:10007_t:CDS:1 n=1 Tax=Paraglomus brasilianum TaxID=144538 RepID=A0A9N9GQW5_9GLOM|nr:10007_t:CDS:2 [Paraglomus brasilianum]
MTNTQSKIDLLEEQISKLITENDKLRKENAEIHELKRERAEFLAKEVGLMARIVELEQSAKENAKNTKLRDAELNAKIEAVDIRCDDTPTSDITNNVSNSDVSFKDKEIEFLERLHKEQIRNKKREKSEKKKLQRETAIQELSDDKETAFSIEDDDQDSKLSCDIKTVLSENDQVSNLLCETKTISSKNDQTEISELEQYDETDKIKLQSRV